MNTLQRTYDENKNYISADYGYRLESNNVSVDPSLKNASVSFIERF